MAPTRLALPQKGAVPPTLHPGASAIADGGPVRPLTTFVGNGNPARSAGFFPSINGECTKPKSITSLIRTT